MTWKLTIFHAAALWLALVVFPKETTAFGTVVNHWLSAQLETASLTRR